MKFTKYLSRFGWLPVVLTIDDRTEYDTMHKQGSEVLLKEIPHDVRIYRTGTGEPSLELLQKGRRIKQRNRVLAPLMRTAAKLRGWIKDHIMLPDEYVGWVPFAVRHGSRIAKDEDIELIFATSPPYSAALAGAFLKRLVGISLVLDFRDDWIETPVHHRKPRPLRWINKLMEGWVVRQCDQLVLVTESSRRGFLDRYPREAEEKFVLIPNGADLCEFESEETSIEEGKGSLFTILHAGLLYESGVLRRSPAGLLEALKLLARRHPELDGNIAMVFIGGLPVRNREFVQENGLSRTVTEFDSLPRQELVHKMKSADLLLVVGTEDLPTAVPSKLYEYWAVGGPPILFLGQEGEARNIIEKYKLGFVAEPDEVEAIAGMVLHAYREWESGSPLRISRQGVERYDRVRLTSEIAKLMSDLVAT